MCKLLISSCKQKDLRVDQSNRRQVDIELDFVLGYWLVRLGAAIFTDVSLRRIDCVGYGARGWPRTVGDDPVNMNKTGGGG